MRLRDLATGDVNALTKILNEPEVSKYMSYPDSVSKIVVEDWLNSVTQNPNSILFIVEEEEKPIGCIRFERYGGKQYHVAKLRIWLSSSYHGRGLGKAALEEATKYARKVGIERIEAEVIENNTKAINLYKRMGFERQGLLKKRIKDNGDYFDVIVFGKMI